MSEERTMPGHEGHEVRFLPDDEEKRPDGTQVFNASICITCQLYTATVSVPTPVEYITLDLKIDA